LPLHIGFLLTPQDVFLYSAAQKELPIPLPCKSVGLVEYPSFARALDIRIVTEWFLPGAFPWRHNINPTCRTPHTGRPSMSGCPMFKRNAFPVMTADEAVRYIKHEDTIAFSGFSPAGSAKVVPRALAAYAQQVQGRGDPFRLRVLTGASSGRSIDDLLAQARAIGWRAPYQAESRLRQQINAEEVEYVDMHLSHVPQAVAFGFFGPIDLAVIEATEVSSDGRVYLTTSVGASPTYLKYARKVVIEINRHQSPRLREMTDIVVMPPPPRRFPLPVFEPCARIGWPYAVVDPDKVVAVVESDEPDHVADFAPADAVSRRIADHVVEFLLEEMRAGRIPQEFLPLQAGVGNIANGVLALLGQHPEIPAFQMYSEVFQDAMVDLMRVGKLTGASATALTVSSGRMQDIYNDFNFFAERVVLRPQEVSNHPGIIRRLCQPIDGKPDHIHAGNP
jgi:propionyl-CoA:succinyl-CoA transferase